MAGKWTRIDSYRAAFTIGLATFAATTINSASAHAESVRKINIPAQPLASAIAQIGRSTDTDIIFTAADVRGRRSPALKGSYSAEEAVTAVLRKSSLKV